MARAIEDGAQQPQQHVSHQLHFRVAMALASQDHLVVVILEGIRVARQQREQPRTPMRTRMILWSIGHCQAIPKPLALWVPGLQLAETVRIKSTGDHRMHHRPIPVLIIRTLLVRASFRAALPASSTTMKACSTMKACLSMGHTVTAATAVDNP